MNRLQIRRTSTPGKIPALTDLLVGELGFNLIDNILFINNGTAVRALNTAEGIITDSQHQFVTQAEKDAWNTVYALPVASDTVLGGIKIPVTAYFDLATDGTLSLRRSGPTVDGYLAKEDFAAFAGKQNALGFTPVNKEGDTMEGPLVLPGDPTEALQASTKQYVDNLAQTKLDKAGGTMTGSLVLNSDPSVGLGAATKQYVDALVNTISGRYGAPVEDLLELSALPSAGLQDKQLRLVEDKGSIYRYDTTSTATADGAGVIIPDDAPAAGRWLKVQAATQNHNALVGLQGGASGDYLHLTSAEKNSYDAHLNATDLHVTPAQSLFLDSITASAVEINRLVGITGNVQTLLNEKQDALGYEAVNRAGDTMTGPLVLSADPLTDRGAATKQYVDNLTVDCGQF